MHTYIITDRLTGEQSEVVAPNRGAALKAHVSRRLSVTRMAAQASTPDPPETPADREPSDPSVPPVIFRSKSG